MKVIILLFLLYSTRIFGQQESDSMHGTKNNYVSFLFESNNNAQSRLFTATYQYLYSPIGKSLRTGGMNLSLGLNLARFVSNKVIVGLCLDVKGFKGFSKQKFTNQFVNDFNNSLNSSFDNSLDSIRTVMLSEGINQNKFSGNYMGNIGVMISLFPQRYGGILLSIKKGYRAYPIWNAYAYPELESYDLDYITLDLKKNYALELTFKPTAFFKNSYIDFQKSVDANEIWKTLVISLYYEKLNFKESTFDSMKLDKIVNSNFMNQFGIDHRFGVKVGFGFY